MPYQRLARHVLEEWRTLERRLLALDPLAPEAEELIGEARALRDEYQHLIAGAMAHDRPVPPPFPDLNAEGHEVDGPDLSVRK